MQGVHRHTGSHVRDSGRVPLFPPHRRRRCGHEHGVPEVIVARHGGMEVFGVSVITDLGVEGVVEVATHEDVQRAAEAAQPPHDGDHA